MGEQKKYSLLPTTDSKSAGNPGFDPPSYSADSTGDISSLAQEDATRRRRRLRFSFFKLCLVGMVVYALLWPTSDPEDGEKTEKGHGGRPHPINRRPKNMPPFSFEEHMQSDVEQIIAGSLESK